MLRSFRYPLFGMLLILAVGAVAACGGDDDNDGGSTATVTEDADHEDPATTVGVALNDFTVTPEVASAPHGQLTFAAQNLGATPHELLVVATDLAADALPVDGAEVDETQLEVLIRLSDIAMGQSVAGTAELGPGSYVLFCNVAGHYALGMTAGFTLD